MPTTEDISRPGKRAATSVDDILAAAAPKAVKKGKAKYYASKGTRSAPARGPGGKFVSGRQHQGFQVEVTDADTFNTGAARIGTVPAGRGISKSARVKNIRAQRRAVLNAIKEARARGLRDGTIKRLKAASRQLLHRSQLARGL